MCFPRGEAGREAAGSGRVTQLGLQAQNLTDSGWGGPRPSPTSASRQQEAVGAQRAMQTPVTPTQPGVRGGGSLTPRGACSPQGRKGHPERQC